MVNNKSTEKFEGKNKVMNGRRVAGEIKPGVNKSALNIKFARV